MLIILILGLIPFFFLFLPFMGDIRVVGQNVAGRINFCLESNFIRIIFSWGLIIIFFCIIIYRFIYFSAGLDFIRFFFLLFFFFLSILILIFHERGLVLFLGWDGLGVTSYLLVCYYLNWKSLNGAIVTLMTNRIGDVCLFWFIIRGLNFFSHTTLFYFLPVPILIFLMGSFTKRAQRPFSSWLPQAIRAPTPVSSLVHRRTLVTAGIFICFKYFCFLSNHLFLIILIGFGILTIFIAGLSASVEKDAKKIIALRTLSQMGLLMFSLGIIIPIVRFIHLITHAFFKRCIFLQIGFYILSSFGCQDRRGFSSINTSSKLVTSIFIFCSVRLCGLIFSRGFIRKDLLISIRSFYSFGLVLQALFSIGIILTFVYTSRIIIFIGGVSFNLVFSQFSSPVIFVCSSPLLGGGILGGWIFLYNILIPPIQERFFDKGFPLFYIFVFFSFSCMWFLGEKIFLKICFLDYLYSIFLYFFMLPGKELEFRLDYILQDTINRFFGFFFNLKILRSKWPLGGTLILIFLLFIFFLSSGVLAFLLSTVKDKGLED